MFLRILSFTCMIVATAAQAARVDEIEAKIQRAKATGKHVWLQLIDDNSISVSESQRFEKNVFTSGFKQSISAKFEVIEVRSSEIGADNQLSKWVTAFKPAGKLTTILLDDTGSIYLKQNPDAALGEFMDGKGDKRGAQKHFRERAFSLHDTRAAHVKKQKAAQEIRELPFLQTAIDRARVSGRPLLVNLAPTDTASASGSFATLLQDVFDNRNTQDMSPVMTPTEPSEREKFRRNQSSILGGIVTPVRGNTTAPSKGFLVFNVATTDTKNLPPDQKRFFDLVGMRPQDVLAVIQPDGTVDAVLNPHSWVLQNKKTLGGLPRVQDVEVLRDWLAEQPAIARGLERSGYCGGVLNLMHGLSP